LSHGSIEFHVARPPAEVFPYVADLERAPEWVPDLISVEKLGDGPVRVGSRFRQEVRAAGRTGHAELEVTEYEPPRRFAHRGKGGPAEFKAEFTLEPDGEGTRVRHDFEVRMKGLFKLASGAVEGWVERNAETAVANLKRVIEEGGR
jgi:carbon monoxide dehydrogenase subunit G